jgi:uncharacterized protein YhaN
MRINELRLLAFGPFAGQVLDFSQGQHGVHVVYGPNEAGKSSSLRALRDALFGIPHLSRDNFRHDYSAMRIGFTLQGADGRLFSAIRKKGNRNTLLSAETEEPLSDAGLVAMVSGITRAQYERMFGLDHAGLVEGGRELSSMQGSVGETLFSAAGGISSLRKLQEKFDEDARELFLPRGKKRLNTALLTHAELKKQLRQQQLVSRDYAEKHATLKSLHKDVTDSSERLADLRAKRDRLIRLRDSLPLVEQRRQNSADLADYADVRLLRADFGDDVRKANEAWIKAESQYTTAKKTLAGLVDTLRELAKPAIDARHWHFEKTLAERTAVHRKEMVDLPGLRRRAETRKQDVALRLQRIRPDLALDDYVALAVSAIDRAQIQELGTSLTEARTSEAAAKSELSKAEQAEKDTEKDLANGEPAVDTSALQDAIDHARSEGDADSRLANLKTTIARRRDAISKDLLRAGRWAGDLVTLASMALPTPATVAVHEAALNEAARNLRAAKDALADAKTELRRVTDALEAKINVEGDLPSDTDVLASRSRRDGLWAAIRALWSGAAGAMTTVTAEGLDAGDTQRTGDTYEQYVLASDEVVDRVRHEHARVSERARLESEKKSRLRSIEAVANDVGEAQTACEQCHREWKAVWEPLAVEHGTPAEMREWLGSIRDILSGIKEIDALGTESHDLSRFIEAAHKRLSRQLKDVSGPDTATPTALGALCAMCQRLVADQTRRKEQLAAKQAALEKARSQVKQLTEALTKQTAVSQKRQAEWESCMSRLGLPTTVTPAAAGTQVNEWVETYSLAHELLGPEGQCSRIKHIEEDLTEYVDLVARAADTLGLTVSQLDPPKAADVAGEILASIQASKTVTDRRTETEVQKKAAEAADRDRKSDLDSAGAKLLALSKEAGVDSSETSAEHLLELYDKSQERRRLEKRRDEIRVSLQTLAAQEPLDEWADEATRHGVDDLVRRIATLDQDIDAADRNREQNTTAVGELKNALENIGSGTAAIAIASQIQGELVNIENLTREYALLRVSSNVLRKAIEQFGERNKGELLGMAGDYFATLTHGAFSGLVIDYDDERPVIAGRKANVPAPVRVEAMSEGTADQLYLALRLAYLSTWTDRHEPLPLILDDVLMAFDDDRAAAALKAFSTLSEKTQIILFTHHQHIVEIAKKTMPEDVLSVQELPLLVE